MKTHVGAAAGLLMGLFAGWMAQPTAVEAADHLDFPQEVLERNGGTLVESGADISDLLSWMPERGRMAVVMNLHPSASPQTQFSDAIDVQFRFRRVTLTETDFGVNIPQTTDAPEVLIRCDFDVEQHMTCRTPIGSLVTPVGEVAELGDDKAGGKSALKAWAGVRADSFFVDIEAILATIKSAATDAPGLFFPRAEPVNIVGASNVLSIALELDVAAVLGIDDETDLVAVNVETARK